MKILLNKPLIIIIFNIILLVSNLFSSTYEINDYRLEINEKSGRFSLSKKNIEGKYINSFTGSNSRTSTFSIYENNGFYALGDSFRYRRNFTESEDGGVFTWTSKDLFVEQSFSMDRNGLLEIIISITNISTASKSAGLKFVLDTNFENEDYFYLKSGDSGIEINKEYEIEEPGQISYWTSAVKNSKGVSLMSIPTENAPSRIIFGNWDLLDDADYYYKTVPGREYNNPPYSINDNAVLYLYSPKDILPQNSLRYSICFRAIDTVENYNEIVLLEKPVKLDEPVITIQDESEVFQDVVTPKVEEESIEEPVLDTETEVQPEKKPDVIEEKPIEPEQDIEVPIIDDVPDVVPIKEPELEVVPEESLENRKITNDYSEQIETVIEIRNLIESLSRPGIITEERLSQLEEYIQTLEDFDINEN